MLRAITGLDDRVARPAYELVAHRFAWVYKHTSSPNVSS